MFRGIMNTEPSSKQFGIGSRIWFPGESYYVVGVDNNCVSLMKDGRIKDAKVCVEYPNFLSQDEARELVRKCTVGVCIQ